MKLLRKPAIILINVAVAAVVGALAYNYKSKAVVASDYLDGVFGGLTPASVEKNNTNGNLCIIVALLFFGLAVAGILLFSKSKKQDVEKN